jgi:ABC-2 type transport system ATP-binding protein
MNSCIEVKNIIKKFGDYKAVNKISFKINKGEILGFLGPNGAGKTTTMRMITGYLAADNGSISVFGHDISKNPIIAKEYIGYLPEGAPLYPELSPRMFLEFVGNSRGIRKDSLKNRINYVIKKLHLENVIDQAIDTLSKGFKRRVGLALSIIHDPEILILDEPTDGLDPVQKHEVRQLIKEMAKDKIIIISTHILEEVEAICSRAIIIAKGKIITDSKPDELFKKHKYHNAVSLELKESNPDEIVKEISKLKDVKDIEVSKSKKSSSLTIIPKNSKEIISEISKLVFDKKWQITSLSLKTGKLDEVFREIVSNK